MKKTVLLLILLLLCSSLSAQAVGPEKLEVIYFGTEGCIDCQNISYYLKSLDTDKIRLTSYEILDQGARDLLYQYNNLYGVEDLKRGVVPVVFIGDTYLSGEAEILEKLEAEITRCLENDLATTVLEYVETPVAEEEAYEKEKTLFNSFVPLTIFTAGLLDGLNPCAIAMLLFFISFVFASGKKEQHILFIGLSFILGTFLAYLGIGLGLFQFATLFANARLISIGIYLATILLALTAAGFNLYDFLMIKKGKVGQIKNQLPKKLKGLIHHIIRKNNNGNLLFLTAFLSGFVISFLEFFCTGQIYLPTITLILSLNPGNMAAISYLLLYNIAFVLPLVLICIVIYTGKKVIDVSQLLIENLHLIKLLGALFFVLISLFMFKQLVKIW